MSKMLEQYQKIITGYARALQKRQKKVVFGVAALLMLFQFSLQIHLAKTDAATTDEPVHIAAGYTYLTNHDFRFNPEHPPLIKMLAALPLLFLDLNEPKDTSLWNKAEPFFYDSWVENRIYGEQFLYGSHNDAQAIIFWARLPVILLTLLLAVTIFVITRKLFGNASALLALTLYVFNPTITAHGHLVTTDIGVTLFYTLSAWFLYKALKNPTHLQWLIFGVVLGLAQLTKFTAVIFVPFAIVAIIVFAIKATGNARLVYAKGVAISAITCLITIWAGYGFNHVTAPPVQSITYTIAEQNHSPNAATTYVKPRADQIYSRIQPYLVPRDYFKGLFMVIGHVENGHDSYLLGHTSKTGWWYYFPVVLLVKTPLFSLLLFAIAIYVLIKKRDKQQPAIFVLLAGLFFFLFAMTSKANLGVRHVLPLFPAFLIATGMLLNHPKLTLQKVIGVLVFLQMVEFVIISPHFLSYFNQFAGGSYNGYKTASDSNLDWGQELIRIRDYVNQNCAIPPFILYSWNGDLALDYYHIPHKATASIRPGVIGTVIASTSSLTNPEYAWLRNAKPTYKLSPAVFVYEFTGNEPQ